MKNSRLLALFKSLEHKEVLEFGRYLKSPFMNRDPNIVKLYAHLKKYHPEMNSLKLNKEVAFKKIFAKQDFQIRKINDVMSDLSKKLESYLVFSEVKEDELEYSNLLVKALKKRKLNEQFIRVTKETAGQLEKRTERNMSYFYAKLRLNHEVTFHPAAKKTKEKIKLIGLLIEDLDKFYILAKLRYYYELLLMQGNTGLDYHVELIDELMSMASSFEDNPLFEIYRLSIEQFQEPTDENYKVLKKLILNNMQLGNSEEKVALMDLLIQYTTQSVRKGKTGYIREIFDLYKFRIQENMLIEDGYLMEAHLFNIVDIGCTLKEFEFVQNTIHGNKKHLRNPEIIIPICEATLCFAQKEYTHAIKIVSLTNTENFRHTILIRVLEIKCNYELDDTETTLRLIDSYNSYLSRNKAITPQAEVNNKNFIKIIRLLLKPPHLRPSKEALLVKIEEPNIAVKSWLMAKIKQLKK